MNDLLLGAKLKTDAGTREKDSFPLLLVLSYVSLLLRDAFGAPFRYIVDVHHLSPLWYLPDLLTFLAFLAGSYKALSRGRKSSLFSLVFLLIYSFIGYLTSESVLSVVSALKMFIPFFVGFHFSAQKERLINLEVMYLGILSASMLGLFASQYIDFPWINYATTTTFGYLRTAANQRTFGGDIVRLSGFASDNAAAAYMIMICSMFLSKRMGALQTTIMMFLSFYSIYLTTSRTVGVGLALYCLLLFLQKQRLHKILNSIFAFVVSCFLFLPFIMPIIGETINQKDVPSWAYSMLDRVHNTWVNPFIYMWDHMPLTFFSGMGLGAVAFPSLFSPVLGIAFYSPDNFMLVNYLMFGLLGLGASFIFLRRALKSLKKEDLNMLTLLLIYGMTVQGYGVSTYIFIIGLLIGKSDQSPEAPSATPWALKPPIRS